MQVSLFGTPVEFQNVSVYPKQENLDATTPNSIRAYGARIEGNVIVAPSFELRATARINKDEFTGRQMLLSVYLSTNYEVYWDGVFLGANGKTVDGVEIETGRLSKDFILPVLIDEDKLHDLRIVGYHSNPSPWETYISIDSISLDDKMGSIRQSTMTYLLFVGFSVFGAYLLAIYFLNRNQLQLLFGGLSCVLFGIYAVIKLLYYQIDFQYSYLGQLFLAVNTIKALLSITSTLALLTLLNFKKTWHYASAFLPFILSLIFEYWYIIHIVLYFNLVISISGLVLRRRHALQSFVVVGFLIFVYHVPILENQQFIGHGCLMLFLLFTTIRMSRKQYRKRVQAELRNSRLQLELVKSKIQPHFVLNSLTSAMEWMETNPKEGVQLIHELAKEFETLSDISEKTKIPITLELESCHTYLNIMGFRKKAKYELHLQGIESNLEVPPSIFRNLLENALTHNPYQESNVTFTLTREAAKNGTQLFRFSAPLVDAKPHGYERATKEGTGIRYIKARLAESYPIWDFKHGPADGAWVTEIVIPT